MPNNKYNIGDTVYFVESQRIIREVRVIKCGGGFYTMKFVDGSGGIRLRENRLFSTKEEAEKSISKTPPTPQREKRYRSPWDD
ncbi:MAG: hypothetical protein J1F18_13510 [Lachnospiraceae bacterium]|nr:hypothetical protein [Lachnospiraceae bacterium]